MLSIFILICAYIVLQISFKIMAQYKCLDDQTIEDYMLGKLSRNEKAYDQAIAHLGICEDCQERLSKYGEEDALDGIEDHLVE